MRQLGAEHRDFVAGVGDERTPQVDAIGLRLDGLSDVEAGALLWLLQLEEGHHLRIGFARPVGYGSVRAELDGAATTLTRGDAFTRRWRSVRAPANVERVDPQPLVDAFQTAVTHAYGDQASRFLRAFTNAAVGPPADEPIHYPTLEGEHYTWFTRNENSRGRRWSLPPLEKLEGLPVDPTRD